MPRMVRCGLIQARNVLGVEHSLGEIRDAMVRKHVEMIEQAAQQKVQILCLQELFYGPYFCAEQDPRWYELTETVPDGPTIRSRTYWRPGSGGPRLFETCRAGS